MSFTNKTIAIIGAASGIGLATARLLASQGARISLADTNCCVNKYLIPSRTSKTICILS
jgi:NAD(P)-dependent dehydrogenase (short-subunit alcohol dehydrogenase family)